MVNIVSYGTHYVLGGMSDKGYSSMTLEDAKRISVVIGSQDSLESLGKHRTILKSADPRHDPNHRKIINKRSAPVVKSTIKYGKKGK